MADEIEDTTPDETEKKSDRLTLSLTRRRVEVDLEGEDGGVATYTLREMTGTERDQYLADMSLRTKWDKGVPKGLSNYKGIQSSLISRCLFDPNGRRVEDATIQKWPASVQTELFKQCQKMNGLGDDSEAGSKNG